MKKTNCPKLKNEDFFFADLKINNKNKYSNKLIIYHRNILSLNKERDELSIIVQFSLIRPHLTCLSEHHLREQEIKYFLK